MTMRKRSKRVACVGRWLRRETSARGRSRDSGVSGRETKTE